jgi:hypothetical protein
MRSAASRIAAPAVAIAAASLEPNAATSMTGMSSTAI